MIRLGLCCIFRHQPIKFRRTTATYLSTLSSKDRAGRLSEICLSNADNLMKALIYCKNNGIGAFRINSQILPLKTHPDLGYDMISLPDGEKIMEHFKKCGRFCKKNNIRTSFHPDQFIVLSSPHEDVVKRSVSDLEYHAQVAKWVNADVINIHAGGVYGDKRSSVKRLQKTFHRLSNAVKSRLTLENDDKSYTPEDLLPICKELDVPMVYDVHHHRCLKDSLSIDQATELAIETWNREPLFHVSSPLNGWNAKDIRKHHDYIDIRDFPSNWRNLDITVEVEAKAKEDAIFKLLKELN